MPEFVDKYIPAGFAVDGAHDIVWAREVFKAQQDVGYVGEAAAVGACELGASDNIQEGPRGQAHSVTPDPVWLE